MSGQGEGVVKLPKGVSVTVGQKTFRGECPERLLPPEHKLRKVTERKKTLTDKSTTKVG